MRRTLKLFSYKVRWYVEALFWLAYYRMIVRVPSLHSLSTIKGCYQAETLRNDIGTSQIVAVKSTITRLAKMVPWKSKCLDQALAAQKMLFRLGLPSTLYIGMKRSSEGQWKAHAWVRCGSSWVIGYRPQEQYTVLGSFAKC
jgi:hypothetical protein